MSSEFGDGLKFGIGAYLGWLLIKWGITILIIIVICATVTIYVLSRMSPQDIENVYKDQVTYKVNCTVRARPSYHSHKVGKAKAWSRLIVTEKKDGWLKVRLHNGRTGWAGCVERIIYNGSTNGSVTTDL